MTPRPPCCAMAIARLDSVTVSIAALSSGTFSRILRVSRVETSTCVGSTVECCGTSRTSSNVSAVAIAVSVGRRVSEPAFNSIEVLAGGSEDPPLHYGLLQPAQHHAPAPWHFLYFFPLPHGHGSLRPTFGSSRRTVLITAAPPVR